MQADNQVKILLRYHSDVLDQIVIETLWATIINEEQGIYKINNIPFYGPLLASDDIVYAEFDSDEQMLTYRRTVENSGNSIILIVLMDDKTNVETIREEFRKMGCESEGTGKAYFTMEIPFSMSYRPIVDVLQEYERKGVLAYSEPCLSSKHSYDAYNSGQ
jgi:hypothetical protein